MSRRKKINKFKVAIVVFALLVFFMSVTGLGRFTYNAVRDRYLSSKKFYFSSDLLVPNGAEYEYANWDGLGIYEIDMKMFSKNNDLERYNEDLKYSVKLDYNNSKLECTLDYPDFSKATGNEYYREEAGGIDNRQTINGTTNESDLVVYVRPKAGVKLEQDSEYTIKVTAYTSEPYKKTIEGTFKIKVSDVSYTWVKDNANIPYVLINVRNNRDYDSNVTVTINTPSLVALDMTNRICYEVAHDVYPTGHPNAGTENTDTKVNIDGTVAKSITFNMPKGTSEDIKFYKVSNTNGEISDETMKGLFTIKREK